jgi:hypothetical protein
VRAALGTYRRSAATALTQWLPSWRRTVPASTSAFWLP